MTTRATHNIVQTIVTCSTTAAMDFNTNLVDWANDAYILLDRKDGTRSSSVKYAAFSNPQTCVPAPVFSFPLSLLAQASIERYCQITPPIDISPAELRRDSLLEYPLPVQQPQNKPPRLDDRNVEAFQNYQSQQPGLQQLSHQDSPVRASKRRRTSKPAPADQSPPSPPTSQQTDNPSPQPPKRKRGRPKSLRQMVEACTVDGFLVQVSLARQSHLEKNRVAACKCRMRKKEYINGLESRAREHSNRNRLLKEDVSLLREEMLKLKSEVLRHAGCGFGPVEKYLARCVDDLLDTKAATGIPGSGKRSRTQSLAVSMISPSEFLRLPSADLPPNRIAGGIRHQEDHSGFDLLEDIDDKIRSPNVCPGISTI